MNDDGSLDRDQNGIYHLTHLALAVLKRMKGKVYERDVVLFVCGVEAVVVALAVYVYL